MEINQLYINLIKDTISDRHRQREEDYKSIKQIPLSMKTKFLLFLDDLLRKKNFAICKVKKVTEEDANSGRGWPTNADTMIGLKRLNNIEYCINDILKNNISGDLIETGVWRGGATIFMKAILKSMGSNSKKVWVADSFEGLPKPNKDKYVADSKDEHYKFQELSISLEQVKFNFQKYNLLDENVKFLKGWFKDTLPKAPIKELSLVRLDGDMYESTMDGLTNLYPKLNVGGYIIIDDYEAVPGCKKAVTDYRKEHNINDKIIKIDWTGVYWKKEKM